MSDSLSDLNRAESIRMEKELAASSGPAGQASVMPALAFGGDTVADAFQAAADWARANPDFPLRSVFWEDDPVSTPRYTLHALFHETK